MNGLLYLIKNRFILENYLFNINTYSKILKMNPTVRLNIYIRPKVFCNYFPIKWKM